MAHQRHGGVPTVSRATSKDAAPDRTTLAKRPWLRWMTMRTHRCAAVIL